MKTLLIANSSFLKLVQSDFTALRLEGELKIKTVAIDDSAAIPVEEILKKGGWADRIGWWWNGSRTDHYLSQLAANPDLTAMLSDSDKGFQLFFSESHHRISELAQLRDRFPKIYVPNMHSLDRRHPGLDWLPPGCPISIEEAERLLRLPYKPKIDIVYPFNFYFLGDRVSRLSAAIKLIRRLGVSFQCGTYGSTTPHGFAYERNYFNILAVGRVVLNFSIYRDLNQRLFEASLIGATTLSEMLPDHDALAFDKTNAFFFKRDLSNFEDTLSEALTHEPRYGPRLHVRNHHLTIHRVAEFLSRLTGHVISVESSDLGQDDVSTEGKIEYLVQNGDFEYGDINIEIMALQCCLYNRIENCIDHEAAYLHLRNIAHRAEPSFSFENLMPEAIFLATTPISPAETVRIAKANNVAALRDQISKSLKHKFDANRLAVHVQNLALEYTDLPTFRIQFRRLILR